MPVIKEMKNCSQEICKLEIAYKAFPDIVFLL